ncbi:MAG: Lrp/AsnC family transcriptional regulator [Chloroflexota bacterium]
MTAIESIDRQIVDLLMEDGRMSCAEIARRIGPISERTVRYRLERLVQRGVIQVVAIPNPQALGYSVIADVFLQVEPASIMDVARRVAQLECVSYVSCSMGEQDVSIQVVARDTSEVYALVTEVIANIPGVRKTTTLLVPRILKDVYQWHIPADESPTAKPGSRRARETGPGARRA